MLEKKQKTFLCLSAGPNLRATASDHIFSIQRPTQKNVNVMLILYKNWDQTRCNSVYLKYTGSLFKIFIILILCYFILPNKTDYIKCIMLMF